MRLPGGASGDPLLRFGAAVLALAIVFAAAVAAYALLRENPAKAANGAVKASATSSEPLVRSDPGIEPWVEEDVPPPRMEPEPQPRRYDLPSGAALGLTIGSIGLYDVPVLRSNTQGALDNGVVHARGTSMPWSGTPERNVYLAGHRLGWPGTGSHLVFYRLDELSRGDEISLKGRDGGRYVYRVTESFVVSPDDTWVMGRIRGRDMLTLQTCTPIPGFQKRLIVRAERV